MRHKIIIASLLMALIAATKQTESLKKSNAGFFYSMPKTLVSGKNETICLSTHFASLSSPAKVIIDLKIKEKHFYTTRSLESEHTCFELNVPISNNLKEPQFASVRIQVQLNGIIYSAHNQDPVVIYPNKKINFVETDRKIYKSEDKIKIRVLTLPDNLLPQAGYKIHQVRIRNPLDISVSVWENVSTELGLAQLEHQLSKDPIEGKWKIEVEDEVQTFEVSKYVLPRFNVEIIHPKTIYYGASSVTFGVCSKYSYGGSVRGTAFIRLTDSHNNIKPIHSLEKMTDGCANFTFKSHELSLLDMKKKYALIDTKIVLLITATVTEYGTDRIELATAKTLISLKAYTMKFSTENLFMPGLPYQGKLQLHNIQTDLTGETVQICYNIAIKKSWNYLSNQQCTNFTVAGENFINFHILPLRSGVIHLDLTARSLNHTEVYDSLLVVRLYSPSSSYVVLDQNHPQESSRCKTVQQFTVQYTTEKLTEHENVTFYYMVKSRGQIHKLRKITHLVRKHYPNYSADFKDILGTKHKHTKPGSATDKFILKFKLDDRIISNYHLLIYYIDERGEIVAATKEVEVEPCLNNHVKANWSHKQIAPGGTASLLIETKSDSLCSISAVDKAARFMADAPALSVRGFLRPFLMEKQNPESNRKSCVAPERKRNNKDASSMTESEGMWDLKRKKRYVHSFSEDYDAYDIFNKFGTITITNFKIVTKPCYTGPPVSLDVRVQSLTDQYDTQNEEKIAPIRSFFPETWLWELVPVSRIAVVHRTLPHTITNWVTDVLCISANDGVAFSETTEITAFQPFFVDVLTPYSIKRGEILYLHVTLFNFLNYKLPVRITLGDSPGLKLVDLMNRRSVSYCISSNNTITHTFELKGTEIGQTNLTILAELDSTYPGECGPEVQLNKRDVVFKSLIVEPEGYPITLTNSALLCTSHQKPTNNVSWNFQTPDNIVPNTAKARITLNGDLLGQTIENLDDLITMPTGCGEQIMATLAPNLYVLRYLNVTNDLTPSLKQKILRNLKIGYQRILSYAHKDGSFSAFGYHDPAGSMFLTAFVVRTLQEAKDYIYVDGRVIDKAVAWIFEHQLENGCFSTMSHVFQDMGGTSTENSTAGLTSYVMISLLDAKIDVPENVKTNAKYCIRGHYHLDKYTLAVSSYALLNIEWFSEANRMLKKLDQLANHKDNMMWWTNKDVNGSLASDIEITAYVLLSLLHQKTQENLAKAHSIVRWLSTKLGSKGSFRSTQDTVVALDALTKYSLFLNQNKLDLLITIDAFEQNQGFRLKTDDRLKSKKIILKQATNNSVKIKVKGEGCVLVQNVLTYYIKHLPTSEAFKLDLEISPVSNVDECSIATLSPCFKYDGPESQANMAILEVALPSGYRADRASLYKLLEDDSTGKAGQNVKMFEELEDKVVLYLTKLDKQQVCINFNINENTIVKARSEATVKLYDYYKPEYNILQFYKISDKCNNGLNNLTMPEIIKTTISHNESGEVLKIEKKRELNPDFVDMNEDLSVPEGVEGNSPVYMKPNSSIVLNITNSIDDEENDRYRRKRDGSKLNPDFVDLDVDLDTPTGMERNVPMYTLKPNSSVVLNITNSLDSQKLRRKRSYSRRQNLEILDDTAIETTTPILNATFVANLTQFMQNECKWWADRHRKRRQTGTKLNPDFVNKDVEMSLPEGMEGNMPTYVKPGGQKQKKN